MTHPQQVGYCVEVGVHACGLVLAESGPRTLTIARATEIFDCARRQGLTTVFVFKDQGEDFIRTCLASRVPNYLQFHGSESPEFCLSFGLNYIKSCAAERFVGDESSATDFRDFANYCERYNTAAAILLDHSRPGSGQSWTWRRLPPALARRTIVAGGISSTNVVRALTETGCAAVDVSSGVEAEPGRKDEARIAQLMTAVRLYTAGAELAGDTFSF
ncbi:MAG: phosphoribosylanthranilate isomerase [Proteobacteria bacterium]|nr:phosphoribosylanthranilate isomerase [Pseudomonadota bacterium]